MLDISSKPSAAELGQLLRDRREKRGLTQEELAAEISTDKSYISKLEGGIHNVARSKYFPAIAKVLSLSEADIRLINPSAVFEVATPAGFPVSPYEAQKTDELYMPEGLQELIDKFGDDPEFSGLRDPAIVRQMAMVRHFDGGPQTMAEWLTYYTSNKRWTSKNRS